MHDYLFHRDGELLEAAKKIPELRIRIDSFPETSATFTRKDLSDIVHTHSLTKDIMTFLGTWECTERYKNGSRSEKFVNPNYVHIDKYTDCYVECRCGVIIDSYYSCEHSDECRSWWRLEARAQLGRQHDIVTRKCAEKFGWPVTQIGPRLGKDGNIGDYMRRLNISMKELRDVFRMEAAETYSYLVREKGNPAQEVADIYGMTPSHMGRLVRRFFGDNMENYRYKKINGREYGWEKIAKKPVWMES